MPKDGITKALAVVRRVGKATPKILGYGLPAVSIGASALAAWNEGGGQLDKAGAIFVKKYVPINILNGKFQTDRLQEGLGSLLVTMGVGKLLSWLGS